MILAGCKPLTPQQTLEKSLKEMAALKTYTSSLKYEISSAQQTASLTGTIQNQLPDQVHAVLESNGQKAEVLVNGSTYYLLDPSTNTWSEIPAETISSMGIDLDAIEQMNKIKDAIGNLTSAGTDTVEGVSCNKFTYDLDNDKIMKSYLDADLASAIDAGTLKSKGDLCLADKTNYLVSNTIDLNFNLKDTPIHYLIGMQNSKFNESVTIPTVPTKSAATPEVTPTP